jgi:hypothetical protein
MTGTTASFHSQILSGTGLPISSEQLDLDHRPQVAGLNLATFFPMKGYIPRLMLFYICHCWGTGSEEAV